MTPHDMRFTFSDTIAGYVTEFEPATDMVTVRTSDGRNFRIRLADNVYANVVRNFGEPYRDVTGNLRTMLVPGRHVFIYCVFYPEGDDYQIDAKQVIFPETHLGEYVFENPHWWVNQARAIADFYLRGQFPDGNYDYRNYRTRLTLAGTHTPDYVSPDYRQETDTISRMVYGLATAYLLTGEDRFLEAAEAGTEYLREHMRVVDNENGVVYWYHGMDVSANGRRKIYASEFGDDYDAIPAYEQIYALAGPMQVYRVTGDPRILSDLDATVALFNKYFRDPVRGGYFSHLDPVTMDPRSDRLGGNRARKNWNSVGDHAPAYLINAVLATGRPDLEEFLVSTADTIVEHFPDFDNSPFVQEKFHEDWSPDRHWGWQQNRAVVGHNLKIAWNLMRVNSLRPKDSYVELARRIADTMPAVGSDRQRGGWYDMVDREKLPGSSWYRLVWGDRKAWWQQEQAILAYLILAGVTGDKEYLRHAREAAAFYNAFFLDHDDGGVYFNVLANGLPYLVGTERLKGSHSMSAYHSMELCYLAAVYIGLLVTGEPLELHFRPRPDGFSDRLLRVLPDLVPSDRVQLTEVWINGAPYQDFDPDSLTVKLPPSEEPLKVRVRITPRNMKLDARYSLEDGKATITLRGELGESELSKFRHVLDQAVHDGVNRTEIDLTGLTTFCRGAVNELLVAQARMDMEENVVIRSADPDVLEALRGTDAFTVIDARE